MFQRRTLEFISGTGDCFAGAGVCVERFACAKTRQVVDITARKRSRAIDAFFLRRVSMERTVLALFECWKIGLLPRRMAGRQRHWEHCSGLSA